MYVAAPLCERRDAVAAFAVSVPLKPRAPSKPLGDRTGTASGQMVQLGPVAQSVRAADS